MRICRTLVTFLFAGTLAPATIGCDVIAEKIQQKVVEKAVEKTIETKSGGQVKIDLEGKKLSGVSKNGKEVMAFGEGVSIPADFPKQVPVYPGANLTISHADTSGAPKYALVFNVADAPDKVVAYYKNELKSFKLEMENAGGGMHALIFIDKVQAKLNVHLVISKGPDDSGANVMLNVETLR